LGSEGTLFPGAFERRVKFLLLGELLLRNSTKDMQQKVLEKGNSLQRGPRWATWKGDGLLGLLRDMKEGSGNGASGINWGSYFFLFSLC